MDTIISSKYIKEYQEFIDSNKDKISEGVYLEICNRSKDMFSALADQTRELERLKRTLIAREQKQKKAFEEQTKKAVRHISPHFKLCHCKKYYIDKSKGNFQHCIVCFKMMTGDIDDLEHFDCWMDERGLKA